MTIITIQPSQIDTRIDQAAPTTNYATQTKIFQKEPGGGLNTRGLYKFDLSSVPSGIIVASATLSIYASDVGGGTAGSVNVYRVLRVWAEDQATWNVYSTGNNWGTAGCDGAADRSSVSMGSAVLPASTPGWVDIPLSGAEVANMLASNNGMVVVGKPSAGDYWFWSREAADTTKRPKLAIDYFFGGKPAAMSPYYVF